MTQRWYKLLGHCTALLPPPYTRTHTGTAKPQPSGSDTRRGAAMVTSSPPVSEVPAFTRGCGGTDLAALP